jgi:uncharacterized protein YydD (DUF2326 family)
MGLVLLLFVMGGASYWYYKESQETIAILNQNIATLNVVTVQQEETINTLIEDHDSFVEENNALSVRLQDATNYQNELLKKLSKHNLTNLSAKKPGLIEERINRATKRLFEEMELETGKEPIVIDTIPTDDVTPK